MARPQKFRHQREDLSDPKVAERLGRFVIEIEDLREQRSKIDELLAAAFDAVDDGGFEKKFVRKVIALRAKEDGVRRDEEDGLESYEFAIEKGVSLARTRRKPANDQFDPITGEFVDDNEASDGSPSVSSSLATREAEESVVSNSPETARNEPEAAAEIAGDCLREPVAAEQGQIIREGDAPRETGRIGGDASCLDTESQMDRATEGSFETGSEAAEKGREAIPAGPEGVDLNHAGAGESPAADQPLTGGDHEVTGSALRAGLADPTSNTGEGAANTALPDKPKLSFRPNCQHPENCASGSRDHCWSCRRAMQKSEEMA